MALALAFATDGLRAREVIDRVMATVNGAVITQSEVNALIRFGFVDRPADGDLEVLIDRLVERRLMLTEVNRYSPPEPAPGLVETRLADVQRRFGSDDERDAALREFGMTVDALSGYVRDELRVAAYLRQRFGAAYQPSEADILQYYRNHPAEFSRNGVLLSYTDAHDDARAAVIGERRVSLTREWVAGLRRRADISVPAIVRK